MIDETIEEFLIENYSGDKNQEEQYFDENEEGQIFPILEKFK